MVRALMALMGVSLVVVGMGLMFLGLGIPIVILGLALFSGAVEGWPPPRH